MPLPKAQAKGLTDKVNSFFINKVALVTGSSRGLGLEIAKALFEKGAIVYLNGRNSFEVNRAVKNLNSMNNTRVFSAAGDVSRENDAKKIIEKIKDHHRRLDFLVNNAGSYESKKFINTDYRGLMKNLSVNLLSHMHLTLLAVKLMKKNNFGRVINISSGSGVHGGLLPSFGYALAKNSLIFAPKILAKEFGGQDITFNTFVLRFMRTRMFNKFKIYYRKYNKKKFVTPLKIHEPASRAEIIVKFLARTENQRISGQAISI